MSAYSAASTPVLLLGQFQYGEHINGEGIELWPVREVTRLPLLKSWKCDFIGMIVSVLQVLENFDVEACVLVRPTDVCQKPFPWSRNTAVCTVELSFVIFPVTS